ncbi:hypothetical protein [Roseateles amylovorans]|uniref:Sel1 repeat family protein n=1 Tax=Roseateles amylovorans TaxID=2978473 RepID=A0ABY6B6C3_9BURK|nr:hypothetical protein [Roseateles amylovorans]UXH80724.1 hypothetical protein N4261_12940 [Roseateles amylovorans]
MKSKSTRRAARPWKGRGALAVALSVGAVFAARWWADTASAHEGVRLAPRSVLASLPVDSPDLNDTGSSSTVTEAAEGEASLRPTHWELCGLGQMPVPPGAGASAAELPPSLGEDALRQARQQVAARLMQGTARARVVSLLMSRPADEAGEGAAQVWAASVMRAALHSGEAQAMHWAAAACPFAADGPSCRLTLLRARVRVEPENALHWMAWAQEEPEQSAAAWAGLQRASRWTSDRLGMARTLLQESGAQGGSGVTPYLMRDLLLQLQMEGAALPEPEPTSAACREAGAPAAACERLAAIAPPAGSQGALTPVSDTGAPYGCNSVARVETRIRGSDGAAERAQ